MILLNNKNLKDSIIKNRQPIILLSASLGSMIVMLGVNFFLTRVLTKESFGDYSYILNVFLFSAIIFNFGYFHSIGRMVAVTECDLERHKLYSAGGAILLILSMVMSICLYIYIFTISSNTTSEVEKVFIIGIPFSLFFLFTNFNESVLQGNNSITLLAISRFLPKLQFLILLSVTYIFFERNVTLEIVFMLYICSLISIYIYIYLKLKPKFLKIKESIRLIHQSNRSFGFNVYLGSLIAVGSTSLTGILISYYGSNNVEVGYYSISQQFATPLSLIPNILATVYFKKFTTSKFIDHKLLISIFTITLISFIGLYILSRPIILLVFGSEYLKSVNVLRFLSFGILLYGLADVFNRFLLAKGKGKDLRNTAYIVGIALLIFNILLIRKFGAIGAAISMILSGIIYLAIIVFYYLKETKKYD